MTNKALKLPKGVNQEFMEGIQSTLNFGKESLLRITAVFPITNQIELFSVETDKVYYFKFFAHQSIQSQLKVGDFLQVKKDKFHVLKENKSKVQGLSGSLDSSKQLLLFEALEKINKRQS